MTRLTKACTHVICIYERCLIFSFNFFTRFVANAGVLAKPVDVSNYKGETPVQLFAHNAMTRETKTIDVYEEFKGTGAFLLFNLTQSGRQINM